MGVFVVSSIEDMQQVIDDYCERTSSHFVVQKKSKNFGLSSLECDLAGHRVQWCDTRHTNDIDNVVEFDGIPHITVAHYQLSCQYGAGPNASKKLREGCVKKRIHKIPTKKCGCPAKINIRQIIKFPEFKIPKNTDSRRRFASTKLKEKLSSCQNEVQCEQAIVGRLPEILEHKFHELMVGGEFAKEVIHPELIQKVKELYFENLKNIEILESLKKHVKDMFYKQKLPDPNRRRYYPTLKDIRNIISRVKQTSKFTKLEENRFHDVIDQNKSPGVNVLLRFDRDNTYDESTSSDEEDSDDENESKKKKRKVDSFIFCYQSPLQQKLMKRYGQECVYLVEVKEQMTTKRVLTYKMHALLVQTNVDFQVVGCMLTSKQKLEHLRECLNIFQQWNFYWMPKYFLIDCYESISKVIGECFSNVNYFYDQESCETAWKNFIKTPSNELQEHSEEVLAYYRAMQYSLTETSLTFAAGSLEESNIWKCNEKFRHWFQESWLPVAKRWVLGYRPEDMFITQHLKSSITECLHGYTKALSRCRSLRVNGFMELLLSIMNDLSKEGYDNYVTRNEQHHTCYQLYKKNNTLSEDMRGVPMSIVPYVHGTCKMAQRKNFVVTHEYCGIFGVQVMEDDTNHQDEQDVQENQISRDNDKISRVISETQFGRVETSSKHEAGRFTVSFGDLHSHPSCTCSHWLLYRLPCVHMFSVFGKVPGWRYNMLSPLYRFNPLLDIDIACLEVDGHVTTDGECQTEICPCYCQPGEIFETPLNKTLLSHSEDFLNTIEKMEYMFKNKTLHAALKKELTNIVSSFSNGIHESPISHLLPPVKPNPNGKISNVQTPVNLGIGNVQHTDPVKQVNPVKVGNVQHTDPVKQLNLVNVGNVQYTDPTKQVNPVKAIHFRTKSNVKTRASVTNECTTFNVEKEKTKEDSLRLPSANVIYIQNPNFKIGNGILNVEVKSQTELDAVLKSLASKYLDQSLSFTKMLKNEKTVANVVPTVANDVQPNISNLPTDTENLTTGKDRSNLNEFPNSNCIRVHSILQTNKAENVLTNVSVCDQPGATSVIPSSVGNDKKLKLDSSSGNSYNNLKHQEVDFHKEEIPTEEIDTKKRKLTNTMSDRAYAPLSVTSQLAPLKRPTRIAVIKN